MIHRLLTVCVCDSYNNWSLQLLLCPEATPYTSTPIFRNTPPYDREGNVLGYPTIQQLHLVSWCLLQNPPTRCSHFSCIAIFGISFDYVVASASSRFAALARLHTIIQINISIKCIHYPFNKNNSSTNS